MQAEYIRADGCRILWGAVLIRCSLDADGQASDLASGTRQRCEEQTRSWIGSKDFKAVCESAGMDPDFIQRAFEEGRLTSKRLKSVEKAHERSLT